MREIKFRVWGGEMMINDFQESFDSQGSQEYFPVLSDNGEFIVGQFDGGGDWNELELMQYTGLKDKNGVEIYESDIVSFLTTYEKEAQQPREMVGSVDWDGSDTGFFFNTTDGRCPYVKTYHAQNIKVIGNKYEHPELLVEEEA